MTLLSIVHLSDFHFKKEASSLQRLNKLIEDIKGQTKLGKPILCFTGDLVHSGDESLFYNLLEHFFCEMEGYFSGIYCTPGNHDVQQSITDRTQSDKFLADKEEGYILNNGLKLNLICPYKKDPLENYFIFQGEVCNFDYSNFYYSQRIGDKKSITSFNSTWLSTKREEGKTDEGQLRIDTLILDEAIKKLNPETYNICLMHHPFNWYTPESKANIARKITDNFDLLLYGHEHTPTPALQGFENKCLALQSPAARIDNGLNAYSIIDVNLEGRFRKVTYRCFAEERNEFIPGERITKGGIYYPTQQDRLYWSDAEVTTKSDFEDDIERLPEEFDRTDWLRSNFRLETPLGVKFVTPSISEVRVETTDGFEPMYEQAGKSLTSVISNDSIRTTIVGDKDCGLSTNAFILGREIIDNIEAVEKIPVYIDLSHAQVKQGSFISESYKTCPIDIPRSRIKKYAKAGLLYFLIDGAVLNNSERFNRIIDILDKFFPKCPSIIFASKDISQSIESQSDQLNLDSAKDRVYKVLELDFEQLKQMVRLWKPKAQEKDISTTSAGLVNHFKQMDEPIYASTASMLIETLKENTNFKPVNRVALLDRYVECLLGRFDLGDTDIGGFNSVLKIDLLAYIAGQMALKNQILLSNRQWEEVIAHTKEEKFWAIPANIKDEFIKKGILLQGSDSITFRADYLFSFFVAKDMNSNPKMFKTLTDGDNFYKYCKEITYFAELENTNTLELLDQTMERLVRLEGIIQDAYTEAGLDFDEQWEEMLSDQPMDAGAMAEDIKEVRNTVPSESAHSDAQSSAMSNVNRNRGVSPRHTVHYYEQRWLIAMGIYLDLIRFSVKLDKDDKLRHIAKALNTCEIFLKGLAAKRSVTATQQFSIIGGVMYRNDLAKTDPEAAIRNYSIYAPDWMAGFFSGRLLNEQMLPAFIATMDDATEIGSFLIQSLLLELPSLERGGLFLKSWKKTKIKPLKRASLSHLQRCYLSKSVEPSSEKAYQGIISNLGSNINQRWLEKRKRFIKIQENLSASSKREKQLPTSSTPSKNE